MISEKISKAGDLNKIDFVKSTSNFHKIKHVDLAYVYKAIGMILVKSNVLSGFKDKLTQINKEDISKMILTKYKNFTLEELNKAFEIDRYSSTPIEHFQLFNSTYVAKVIENYLEWKKSAKNENPKAFKPVVKEKSPEEIKQIENDFHKMIFDELNKNGFCHQAWLLYDQVDHPNKHNDDFKKRMYNYELAKEKKNRIAKGIREKLEGSNFVKNRCKALIVCKALSPYLNDFDKFQSMINSK